MNPLHIAFLAILASCVVIAGIWQENRRMSRERWMP